MTLIDLARQAVRLWWVTLTGLALTTVAAAHLLTAPGVYWAHVDVVLLRPSAPTVPNKLSNITPRVIEAASVIQREVAGVGGTDVVSDSISIVDEGIRVGEKVRLPNAGGQWANNFNRPYLTVEVVDETGAGAQARLDALLARVDAVLEARQSAADVSSVDRLTTQLNPGKPTVTYAVGMPRRAAGAAVLLGLGLTVAALTLAPRRPGATSTRPPEPPVGPGESPPGWRQGALTT